MFRAVSIRQRRPRRGPQRGIGSGMGGRLVQSLGFVVFAAIVLAAGFGAF